MEDANPAFSRTTVVIPAMDEEPTVGKVVEQARRYAYQVIVVDGWSRDATFDRAQQAGAMVIRDRRRGKGDAIRCAIGHITGTFTVFMDADGSHDAADIPRLVEPIASGESDHVTGSRLLGGSSELHGGFDEFFRLTGSSLITACINWRFKVRISDSQNGFRALRTDVLRLLDLREDITTIEQEMIIETLRRGYRLSEIPAHETKRIAGESKLLLSRVWFQYGWSLAKNMFLR